eukprot:6488871-Amphidinium_carterae.1
MKSKVTKSSGVLLDLFSKYTVMSELRPLVQKEIKALRVHGLQEGDVFHPILAAKIRSTLAMKG